MNKRMKIYLLCGVFIASLCFFFFRNHYYVPARLELDALINEPMSVVLSWDSGWGFNRRESVDMVLSPQEKMVAPVDQQQGVIDMDDLNQERVLYRSLASVSLPQCGIRRLRLSSSDVNRKFGFVSASVHYSGNIVYLRPGRTVDGSEIVFAKTDLHTRKFNPILFTIHLLLALMITSIVYEIMKLPERYRKSDWVGTIRYIFLEERRWIFWGMLAFSSSMFFLWLWGQWPGMMTVDSFNTWEQAGTLKLNNWHSYVYSLYVCALTQFARTPATICIFQIFATATLGSAIFYFVIGKGVTPFCVMPFFILFALSIPIGVYNIMIWKDVPFAILVCFWAFYLYYLYFFKKSCRVISFSTPKIIILALLLFFVSTIRHNGLIYIVMIPVMILLLNLMPRKALGKLVLISVSLLLLLNHGIATLSGIHQRTDYTLMDITWKINPLAALFVRGYYSENYERDRKIIEKIMPVDIFKKRYDPVHSGSITFLPEFGSAVSKLSKQDVENINSLYLRGNLQNLPIFFADRSQMFFSTLCDGMVYANHLVNRHGMNTASSDLVFAPRSWRLYHFQAKVLERALSNRHFLRGRFIFANGVVVLILLIAVALLYHWVPCSALAADIILVQTFCLFWVCNSNDFRYIYFMYLFSFFVVPLVMCELKSKHRSSVF